MTPPSRIGLVFAFQSEYLRGISRGIKQFAQTRPDWVLVTHDEDEFTAATLRAIRPAGLIVNVSSRKLLKIIKAQWHPVVNVNSSLVDVPFPTIRVDQQQVGRLAFQHLYESGLRRFAFVGHGWFHYSREREAGFTQLADEAACECQTYYELPARSFVRSSRLLALRKDFQRWLTKLQKPVGILGAHDGWALQVTEACQLLRIHVPEEVAVIGAVNDEFLCEMANPPLSTVSLPMQRIGYEAAQALDRLLRGEKVNRDPPLIPPIGIVRRQSTDTVVGADTDVIAAVRFIRDRSHLPLRVTDVLTAVPMSRRTLEMRFQNVLQRGVAEEIRRVHLERAKQLLGTTTVPIGTVAHQSGFGSARYFARVFREETGKTPLEFRHQFQDWHADADLSDDERD